MTFLELRAAIIAQINKSNLKPEEIYGVVTSVEAEVRYVYLSTFRPEKKE